MDRIEDPIDICSENRTHLIIRFNTARRSPGYACVRHDKVERPLRVRRRDPGIHRGCVRNVENLRIDGGPRGPASLGYLEKSIGVASRERQRHTRRRIFLRQRGTDAARRTGNQDRSRRSHGAIIKGVATRVVLRYPSTT